MWKKSEGVWILPEQTILKSERKKGRKKERESERKKERKWEKERKREWEKKGRVVERQGEREKERNSDRQKEKKSRRKTGRVGERKKERERERKGERVRERKKERTKERVRERKGERERHHLWTSFNIQMRKADLAFERHRHLEFWKVNREAVHIIWVFQWLPVTAAKVEMAFKVKDSVKKKKSLLEFRWTE